MRQLLVLCSLLLAGHCAAAGQVQIGPGEFKSALPEGGTGTGVHVERFALDRRPVTNAQFLDFVRSHPAWRRDGIATLFADEDYLSHWSGVLQPGVAALPDQPVTRVSWFAARAYCSAAGARLPTWYEWEFAAAADERHADARQDPAWRARILDWYSQPAGHPLARVGAGPANYYGVEDLHGLVWEWVDDFNALLVSGDGRDQGDPDRLRFCGAGALSLADKDNFAILMRIALLSSLEARSTARSLGFRCASGGSP